MDLTALAKLGAQQRLTEIAQELTELQTFLADNEVCETSRPAVPSEAEDRPVRRRRPMSKAARQAASRRMTAIWKARKAAGA